MRLCWFDDHRLGLVRDGRVLDVTSVMDAVDRRTYPAQLGDLLIANLQHLRPAMLRAAEDAESRDIALGKAVSDLLRRGLRAPLQTRLVNGFHVVELPPDSDSISAEKVRELEAGLE